MRQKMSLRGRKELQCALKETYRNASLREKKKLLDGFIEATGLNRKYAMHLLNSEQSKSAQKRGRIIYGNDVEQALLQVWKAAYFICSKRLAPFMAQFVDSLERHGHLTISEETRTKLLKLSPATIDRLLKAHRKEICSRSYYSNKPPSPLRSEIPIRTFADWTEKEPGYFEIDLVAHNGGDPHGQFCYTLVITDVETSFTEFSAIQGKQDETVLAALESLLQRVPFEVKGIDIDNGSEFLNFGMAEFCESRGIKFTRGREYRKNDQCYVEEKNGSIIRRHAGYQRLEGSQTHKALLELYSSLRIFVNYFQPSAKLLSKERRGAKVRTKHLPAKTPVTRLLESHWLSEQQKQRMEMMFQSLDPVALLRNIQIAKEKLSRSGASQKAVKIHRHATVKGRPSGSRNKKTAKHLPLIHSIMSANPALSATQLREELVKKMPNPFAAYSRNAFIGYCKTWRDAHPEYLHLYPKVYRTAAEHQTALRHHQGPPQKDAGAVDCQG
jgi:hypothetical protein